jgi:hypothetical protein
MSIAEEHRPAADARVEGGDRSPFDRFVEASHPRVSRSPLFILCATAVAIWFASMPLWAALKAWEVATHTVASVVALRCSRCSRTPLAAATRPRSRSSTSSPRRSAAR